MATGGRSQWGTVKRLARTFAADPAGVARALPGHIRMHRGTRPDYGLDEAWDEHLHDLLDATWPCPQRGHVDDLLAEIRTLLGTRGLSYGRQTYGCYSDADSSLCRAAWCTVLHAQPEVVIETGVARGITSRIVLEAMRANDRGHLWSIDLPHPLNHEVHAQTGAAVTEESRPRWSYLEGSSRQRLPSLLSDVSQVGLFIHDSLHTARNTLFELREVAPAMAPRGVMLVDDIGTHSGFATFAEQHPSYETLACPSADGQGVFGLAVNA